MRFFSVKNFLSRRDLQREKLKDYRNIVLVQIIIVVFGLVLSEPLIEDSKSEVSKLIISIFSFFGAIYAFLLWDLLRNFTDSRALIVIILAVLSGIVVTGMLVEFPYYQLIHVTDRQTYLFTIHSLQLKSR
jgi:Kef-type K+ transport system membrane component KefB